MTKRSRHVALAVLGAAAFALAGCTEDKVDAEAFPDVASCKAAANQGGLFSSQDCDAAFAEAQAVYAETAPHYDSLAVCEETHGVGACGDGAQVAESSGGGMGSFFMPLMMGYLMGNMLGGMGNRNAGVAPSQPMYKTADGKFTTGNGTTFANNTGKSQLAPSAFNKPAASSVAKPAMSKAPAVSRGGFGASSGSSGFGG